MFWVKFKNNNPHWKAAVGLTVLLLGEYTISACLGSAFIQKYFPQRPQAGDLMISNLPYLPVFAWIADAVVIIAMLALIIYLYRQNIRKVLSAISITSIIGILRAGLIVLTPLATPQPQALLHNENGLLLQQYGMFPSGHATHPFLLFLFIDGKRYPLFKRLALCLCFVEWTALLLSRIHYSIDIVGGILLTYFVYHEWREGRLFGPLKKIVDDE